MCQELEYAREGFVETPWGRLWYGIAGTGTKPPLLTLHGGPGVPHYYFMHSMRELADDRPVVFYDQLGCGRSERPTDESLWTAERRDRRPHRYVGGHGDAGRHERTTVGMAELPFDIAVQLEMIACVRD